MVMVNLFEAKSFAEEILFPIEGIEGIGLSEKREVINIYVDKLTPELLSLIPAQIDNYNIEIYETGKFYAFEDRKIKWRPAPGGISIGHPNVTAGTLGCVVIDNISGKRVILSNNHILANQDSIQNSRANIGDNIYQPGVADKGTETDTIAKLERWVKLDENKCVEWGKEDECLRWERGINFVDAAIAMPLNDDDISDEILEIGKITSIADSEEGMRIKKSGRTTGLTTGAIVDNNYTVKVNYRGFQAEFYNQILSTYGMCAGGDSGSAVLTEEDNKLVGLLYAGNMYGSLIACKIRDVFEALNIGKQKSFAPLLLMAGFGLLLIPLLRKKSRKI